MERSGTREVERDGAGSGLEVRKGRRGDEEDRRRGKVPRRTQLHHPKAEAFPHPIWTGPWTPEPWDPGRANGGVGAAVMMTE